MKPFLYLPDALSYAACNWDGPFSCYLGTLWELYVIEFTSPTEWRIVPTVPTPELESVVFDVPVYTLGY